MQAEFDKWEDAVSFADKWFEREDVELWIFEISDYSKPNTFSYIISDTYTCVPGVARGAREIKRYRR